MRCRLHLPDMGSPGGFERVLDGLGHQYRRRLLMALMEENPQDDGDAHDAEEALGAMVDGQVDPESVEIELLHNHLPVLADTGYITWNREAGTIETGPNWEEIAPLLALLDEHEDEVPEDWL